MRQLLTTGNPLKILIPPMAFDSSNINEVISVVLKSFYKEFLHAPKSIKSTKSTKTSNKQLSSP